MRSRMEKFGLIGLGLVAGVLVSLQLTAIADKDSPEPLPIEELRAFSEVFGRIKSDYVEPVSDKKLITGAINGMLSGLDPHSSYLDADAFKELQDGTHGEFGGLGIEVGMEDGVVKVISPIEDTPAFAAGIQSGDLIIKLDDTLVKGLSLNDAVKRMRGTPGSKITLTVVRKDAPKALIFTLERAVIKVKSVKFKMLESGYGFVRITQFQERTGENLASGLNKLYEESQGSLKGLVLDLRNNPGGLLNSAVAVSAAFLPNEALVVYTEGRVQSAKMRLTTIPENYAHGGLTDYLKDLPASIKDVPVVLLVNGGSASASEIVAGALQDHKRAVIMGTQTFGKGSVQTILPLGSNTAIKLTTSRYFTPNGRSIQATGIVPDIVIEDPATEEQDRVFHAREADLDRHLSNGRQADDKATDSKAGDGKDKGKTKPANAAKPTEGDAAKAKPAEFGSPEDYQLKQALNLLKGMNILSGARVGTKP